MLAAHGLLAAAGAAPADLDLSTWGTYTCASEVSYRVATPTDGSTVWLAWAPRNKRPIQRRDGTTPMYLTQRPMVNRVYESERMYAGGWVGAAGPMASTTVYPSPDGVCQRGRCQIASGVSGIDSNRNPVTPNLDWAASCFHRSPAGTTSFQHMIGGGTVSAVGGSTGATWSRQEALRLPDNAFGQLSFWLNDGRAFGTSAGARDSVLFGAMLEQWSYVTSYIRTVVFDAATEPSRAQAALFGQISSIPVKMVTGSWSFTVAPVGASSGMVRASTLYGATTQTLFSFAGNGSETIEFFVTGGALYLRVVSGGIARVTSSPLTFSAHQILTVTVDSVTGTLTVAGATTGNGTVAGTAWTRTPGATLYVGARADGSNPCDAAIWCGAPVPTVSTLKALNFVGGQSNASTYGMMDRIASNVQQRHPQTKLVDVSVGATSLAVDWAAGGATYLAAVAKWTAALAADPTLTTYTPVIHWVAGESDAGSALPGAAAAFGANMLGLKTRLEADIPHLVGAEWVVSLLPTWTTPIFGATPTTIGQVRSGQAAFIASLGANGRLIETSDLTSDTPAQPLHFDDSSSHTLAARMGDAAGEMGV